MHGDRLFIVKDNCLESIELPSSIKKVNGKEKAKLTSYTIPTNVTKINDYCFTKCKELTEIKGLEQIKEFGKECLTRKIKLEFNKLQINEEDIWRVIYDLDNKQMKQE